MRILKIFFALPVLLGMSLSCTSQRSPEEAMAVTPATDQEIPTNMKTEIATFGAGCFWCVEAVFQELNGVLKVESGYMGGHIPDPSYREVCTGTTGHAEVTRVTFDPSVISFEELLEVLWTTHDPTTLNRQGADTGTQYRSAIFYYSPEQKMKAEKSKAEVAAAIWNKPIVTEIVPASEFYLAEDYHQEYFASNPDAGYCRIVIVPKVAKVREKFRDKLKQ